MMANVVVTLCTLKTLLRRHVIKNVAVAGGGVVWKRNNSQYRDRKVNLDYDVYSKNVSHLELSPVVVLHSLYGNKQEWRHICEGLNDITGRKIIACDAVNHGTSDQHESMSYLDMTLDLLILLEKLNIKKCTAIGHRMGGKTVMTLALTDPQRVERVALIDVGPCSNETIMGDVVTQMEKLKQLHLKPFKSKENLLAELAKLEMESHFHESVATNIIENKDGLNWNVNLEAILRNYHEILSFPSFNDGVCYEHPSLFVSGENCLFVDQRDYDLIKKRFPLAEVHTVANSTLWMHREEPELLLQMLTSFLNTDKTEENEDEV